MSTAQRGLSRGFSLVELLVAVACAGLLMSVVITIVVSYERSLNRTETQRASGDGGRDALFSLERSLYSAGFGVDPLTAFDMSWFRCATGTPPTGTDTQTTGIQNQAVCRDSTTGPDSLVFMSRDPYYRVDPLGQNGCGAAVGCPTGMAWPITATAPTASPPTITITAVAGNVFYYGQTLELICSGGTLYTMATVGKYESVASSGAVTLTLYATKAGIPYFANAFTASCFAGGALAFAVDRYYYFIETYNGVPWLMLDNGLDTSQSGVDPWATQTAANLLPISPYVEDMQIAYVMDVASLGTAPDSNVTWATGDDPSTTKTEAPYPTAAAPAYSTAFNDPSRASLNPANIRAVRISLDLRSSGVDTSMAKTWLGDALPVMENEQVTLTAGSTPALGYYHRQKVVETMAVENMQSAGMFDF